MTTPAEARRAYCEWCDAWTGRLCRDGKVRCPRHKPPRVITRYQPVDVD